MGEIIWHPKAWSRRDLNEQLAKLREMSGLSLEKFIRELRTQSGSPFSTSMYKTWETGQIPPPQCVLEVAISLAKNKANPSVLQRSMDLESSSNETIDEGIGTVDFEFLSAVAKAPRLVLGSIGFLVDNLETRTQELGSLNWSQNPLVTFSLAQGQLTLLRRILHSGFPINGEKALKRIASETEIVAGMAACRLNRRSDALAHLSSAVSLAEEAGDKSSKAQALITTSTLFSAVEETTYSNHNIALALQEEAEHCLVSVDEPWIQVRLFTGRAQDHLFSGDKLSAQRDLERVDQALRKTKQSTTGFMSIWDLNRALTFKASCKIGFGRPMEAVETMNSVLSSLSPAKLGAYSSALRLLGVAYTHVGEIEQACLVLKDSVQTSSDAGLVRGIQKAKKVRESCFTGPLSNHPAVAQLDEYIEAFQ